jgi:long-chain acyl-CoA synthetase
MGNRQGKQHWVTGLPGVPTGLAKLPELAPFDGLDLSTLGYVSNTAAPFLSAHILPLRRRLPQAISFCMYGLMECTRVSYLDPSRLEAKLTSVGPAIPNSEVYILDEQGRRGGPGGIGRFVAAQTPSPSFLLEEKP